MLNKILLLSSLAWICFASDNINRFAPFGVSNGDTVLPPNDDEVFGPFSFDFYFYGVLQHQLYISNNGLITFNGAVSQYTPEGLATLQYPAIAAYWADVDTRATNGGTVSYRPSTDPTLLATWSAQVPGTFHGIRMFIVTWDAVGYYNEHADKTCTFQAILITDGTNSWVFLNYGSLQWTTGDASGGNDGLSNGNGNAAAIGFSAGNGANYVQTTLSLSDNVVNTRDFVTLVSGSVIHLQTCGNGIIEGTEQCDGGSCCTSNCTFSDTAACYCPRLGLANGEMAYYCHSSGSFYQCLGGVYASQSRIMPCAQGTNCGCPLGVECSCDLTQSPCVTAGTTQTC